MRATVTTAQRLYLAGVPVGVSGLAALATWKSVPLGVLLLAFFFAGLTWYSYLRIPRVADLRDTCLLCETGIGSVEIALSDLKEIDARRWNRGIAAVRTDYRTVFFLRAMPGLLDMFSTIASNQPGLTVRGKLSPAAR